MRMRESERERERENQREPTVKETIISIDV